MLRRASSLPGRPQSESAHLAPSNQFHRSIDIPLLPVGKRNARVKSRFDSGCSLQDRGSDASLGGLDAAKHSSIIDTTSGIINAPFGFGGLSVGLKWLWGWFRLGLGVAWDVTFQLKTSSITSGLLVAGGLVWREWNGCQALLGLESRDGLRGCWVVLGGQGGFRV